VPVGGGDDQEVVRSERVGAFWILPPAFFGGGGTKPTGGSSAQPYRTFDVHPQFVGTKEDEEQGIRTLGLEVRLEIGLVQRMEASL